MLVIIHYTSSPKFSITTTWENINLEMVEHGKNGGGGTVPTTRSISSLVTDFKTRILTSCRTKISK